MYSSTIDPTHYLLFSLVVCVYVATFLDSHHWYLQAVSWAQSSGIRAAPIDVTFEEETDSPEGVLLRQLSSTTDLTAVGTLHLALAKVCEDAGRPGDALRHLEVARDSAVIAAEVAPPPLRAGRAIISGGKEREGLAETRLALSRAYLKHGRSNDADAEITKARNDEFFVGLEELLLTEIIREQGHAKRAIGKFDIALHHYKFARSRVERSADGDRAAFELVKGLLEDEAAIAHLVSPTNGKVGLTFRPSSVRPVVAPTETRLRACTGAACTSTKLSLQQGASGERKDINDGTFSTAPTSFTTRALSLLAGGQVQQAEGMCLGRVNGGAAGDLIIAGARICLGMIARDKGELINARQHLNIALTSALNVGNADTYEAALAYEGLFELQSRLHAEGTPRSLLAAQAIFREVQVAAYNADVPESEGRMRAERRLRDNAKPKR